ncbi:hypothetical protein GQ53DRAFT_743891, partial [Thozetella sp. PMI_491]
MSFYGWFTTWRMLLGFAAGGQVSHMFSPIPDRVGRKWCSTRQRGRNIAITFLMFSVGQMASNGLLDGLIRGSATNYHLSLGGL